MTRFATFPLRFMPLALTLGLAACGGGGNVSPSSPHQAPKVFELSWTGETHSTSLNHEAVELGVPGASGTLQAQDSGASQASIQVTIRPGQDGPAKLSIANTGIAALSAGNVVTAGNTPGQTQITATIGNDFIQDTIAVYPRMALACGVNAPQSAVAYSFASGTPVPVNDPSSADVYLTGPACPAAFFSPNAELVVQRSMTTITRAQPFSQLRLLSFIGGPATYDLPTFQPSNPEAIDGVEFGLANGSAVKFMITSSGCAAQLPSCSSSVYAEGLYLVSQGGTWAY